MRSYYFSSRYFQDTNTFSIFWLILAPFEYFMVNFSKSCPFHGARVGHVCLFWLDSSSAHWVDAEWESPSTESMQSETPCQMSQHGMSLHINWANAEGTNIYEDFIIQRLAQLMWSLTPRWLSWHGVSLGVDSVHKEWDSASTESPPNVKKFEQVGEFKNKIKNTQKPYYLAYTCLISAKNQNQKSFSKCTFKLKTFCLAGFFRNCTKVQRPFQGQSRTNKAIG
jgi:hypothetical protein